MKNCEECQSLIDMYMEDELTKDTRTHFLAHISSCNECREALEFAQSVKATLNNLPEIEVPSDFTKNVRARIEAEKKHKKGIGTYFVRYGSLAACLVLAVAIARGVDTPDFTKNSDNEYDYTLTEAESLNPQQDAGEKAPAPTKDNTANKADKKETNEKIKSDKPAPTIAPLLESETATVNETATAEPVEASPTAETDYGIASLSLFDEEDAVAFDAEKENQSARSGKGSSRRIIKEPVTLSVRAEQFDAARMIISEYTALSDGAYSATPDGFAEILAALSDNDIEYTQIGEIGEENVKYILKIA